MTDIKTFFNMLHQINYILDNKQRRQFVGIFILGLFAALFETLGVSVILPFIEAIMTPDKLMNNKYIRMVIGNNSDIEPLDIIIVIGVGIVLVYLTKNVFLIFANYIQTRFRLSFHNKLSVRLLKSHLERPYSYYITTTSSAIIQAILNDTNSVFDTINLIYQLVSQGFIVVFLGVLLAYSDIAMTLLLAVAGLICFLFVTFGFKSRLSKLGVKTREANQKQYKYLYQAITGNKDIKVMHREEYFIGHYETAKKEVNSTALANSVIQGLPEKTIEFVCVAGIIGAVCVRLAIGVDVDEFITKLAVFAVAAFRIMPSISKCSGYIQQLIFYRPSMDAAYEDIKAFNEYEDNLAKKYEEVVKKYNNDISNHEFTDCIKINNIDWTYTDRDSSVIHNLSLDIHKGESVAFIGESGSGKTTLADIILGLLEPQEGQVTVDGIDIYSIPGIWSNIIGYVPQDVFLVDDTIRANVAFGINEDEVTDEKVWEALDKAQLKSYVEKLPDGINAIVGERGIKFSGGQRQRIAIARALYYNPEVLVLDEATAALDGKTENALMESIDRLHGEKTLIVIAHRLSTIRNCDKIYEVKGGALLERTKKELFGDES